MSPTKLIDDLAETTTRLHAAMQSSSAAAIDRATEAFYDALDAVRAVPSWPAEPALREKLVALRPQLDQARALACLFADMTGQMHELVVARSRNARQPLYGRTGDRFG